MINNKPRLIRIVVIGKYNSCGWMTVKKALDTAKRNKKAGYKVYITEK